jgi:RNA polymerase sigma factor (sigma-70 family)
MNRTATENNQLQNILELANNGNPDDARRLLMRYVRNNPSDAFAWYELSYLVETQEQKIDCLRYVLKLRPEHPQAKKQLKRIVLSARSQITDTAPKKVPTNKLSALPSSQSEQVQPTIKGQVSTNNILPQHKRQVWQFEQREIPHDEQPDILQFLFEDIGQLPIITGPHQELWLGIHLRSIDRLQTIFTNQQTNANLLSWPQNFWETLVSNWELLQKSASVQELPVPKPERWAEELLAARNDIYTLRRSRVRRYMRRVQALADKDVKEQLLGAIHAVVETLAILPGTIVAQLIDFINNHARLPELDEMEGWLPVSQDTIRQQVEHRVKEIKHTLTTGYLRYALRIARGHIGQGLDFGDLVQAGFMGLMRATDKFDYRIQARFGTYATSWIWQSIGREIANHGRTIRLPAHLQENLRKWHEACEQFDDGCQDAAYNTNILFHAGLLKEEDYEHIRQRNRQNKSIAKKIEKRYEQAVEKAQRLSLYSAVMFPLAEVHVSTRSDKLLDKPDSLINRLTDEKPLPEVETDISLIRSAIEEQIFPLLTDRERNVLQLRCGWTDGEERTLEEIGTHYNLTRERIRQVEAKALKRLNNLAALDRLPKLFDLMPDHKPAVNWDSGWQLIIPPEETTDYENLAKWANLDALMDQLPRSDWVKGRSGSKTGQRREQLVTALNSLAAPAHVTDIADQLNEMVDGKELENSHVYNLLLQDETAFILLGQGIFSLVEWEQSRTKEPQPILSCCPMPLPDPPDYEDAFFESVLIGQRALVDSLTARQFVRHMLNWAKTETDQQKWFMQSILSAYYLVDLIPYTFYFGEDNAVLSCTLPAGTIQELRYHCLESLTKRLIVMPEFWWLLQRQQPVRPVDLSELFADIHPTGLDDVLQRLRLLTSLGAVQKLKYGNYRLTLVGEECANQWKKEALIDPPTIVEDVTFVDSFASFIDW